MMSAKPEKQIHVFVSRLTAIVLFLALIGCAGTPKRNWVPPELTSQVGVKGIPDARFWGDEWPKFSLERFENYTDVDFRKYYNRIYRNRITTWRFRAAVQTAPLAPDSLRGGRHRALALSLPW